MKRTINIAYYISYQNNSSKFFFHNSFFKAYFSLNKINKINTLHIRLCILDNYIYIYIKFK